MKVAQERRLYISPSVNKFGLVDRIFPEKGNIEAYFPPESAKNLPGTTRSVGKGYPNIFSNRSVNQNERAESIHNAGTSMTGPTSPLGALSVPGVHDSQDYMHQEVSA